MSFIVVLVRAEAEGQKVENRSEDAAWNSRPGHRWLVIAMLEGEVQSSADQVSDIMSIHQLGT